MRCRAKKICCVVSMICLGATAFFPAYAFQFIPGVGANTPFTTLEGESGAPGGGAVVRTLNPTPANLSSSPELEASGRAFVQLNATGQSVSWVNPVDSCNTINIRESIPDAPAGGGIDATLDLYINGTLRQAIPLTSRQTWVYGNFDQNPATGGPYVLYDESRTFITGPALNKGDIIMLKKDAANTAAFYYIDCIDLESTAPKARPANSLSVADYGATGTGTADCLAAFNSCCSAAKSQGKTVWIPAGKYSMSNNFSPNGVTIEGEGMWYSTLYFTMGQVQAVSCTMRDFCVDAVTVVRNQGMGGFNMKGSNWLVERVWAIHGCWAGYWMCGTNGILRDSRTSMCWGDGLNLNNGGAGDVGINMLAENNFTRGCGDDGATIFSDGGTTHEIDGAILRNNTTSAIYAANGMRIAGGKHVRSENNLIMDDCREGGLYIGVFGATGSDLDSAVIANNTILRCGNSRSPGGISINASPGSKNVSLTLSNNTVKDAQFYGILIASDRITINAPTKNIIDHPALTALYVQGGAKGSAYFDSLELVNRIPGKLAYQNDAASTFSVTFGKHNIGIPDTLPATAVMVAPHDEATTEMAVVQSGEWLSIHCFMPAENGAVNVAVYNAAGRLVWNGERIPLHKGGNGIMCRTGELGTGVFVATMTGSNFGNHVEQVVARRVVLVNKQ